MKPRAILFVDDDSDDRFLLNAAFNELGYYDCVSYAENGEKALHYLQSAINTNELPRLIVLDLNMPKMNGTQVLKAIKQNDYLRDIEIIIFSTAINDPQRKKCLSNGAVNYLVKPIDYTGFLETAQAFYNIAFS